MENRNKALLKLERAASTLLGIVKYGVHVNGYTVDKYGKCEFMWIGQRSLTKLTYPGMMDNMVRAVGRWAVSLSGLSLSLSGWRRVEL